MGYAPAPGFPNMGPLLVESVPEEETKTYYGVRFNEDVRSHLNETWYLEYEGVLPHTGEGKALVVSATRMKVFGVDLCRLGALPGDIFTVVPDHPSGCPDFPVDGSFDYVIREVHSDWLELEDDSGFRIVDGEEEVVASLGPLCFPYPITFQIRPRGAFVAWGSRTGHLHSVRATPDGCAVDPDGDPLFTGRAYLAEVMPDILPLVCPIIREFDGLTLHPFSNPVFTVNLFPGCQSDSEGVITVKPPARGVRWRFDVRSGFTSNTISGGFFPVYQSSTPIEGFLYLLDLAGKSIKGLDVDLFKMIYSYY